MMKPISAIAVVPLLLCMAAMTADQPIIIAPGAKLEKVASEYKFTEGPASDAKGDVYFTDQPNDRIVKWSAADNRVSTFMQPCGRSNGLCFDGAGRLIACADDQNQLWAIDLASKNVTILVKDFAGKLLNGPNDIWVHPGGAMYFTDPMYKRPYWKRDPAPQQDVQAVYRLDKEGKLTRIATDLTQPNGIIGTPDGKTLYVADIGAKKTYVYNIKEDGSLVDKKLFCGMGSDGMTIDQQGNVYLTGNGVTVFDKAGQKIAQIDVPEKWTANICFGGKDRDVLFITASTSVYTLKMAVKGAGSQ